MAINADQDSPFCHYERLFEEDKDGNQSKFIECVRDEHLQEIEKFTQDFKDHVLEAEVDGKVMAVDCIRAWQELDPYASSHYIEFCINLAISTVYSDSDLKTLHKHLHTTLKHDHSAHSTRPPSPDGIEDKNLHVKLAPLDWQEEVDVKLLFSRLFLVTLFKPSNNYAPGKFAILVNAGMRARRKQSLDTHERKSQK